MTGDAGPVAMPNFSRHPFLCHLEELVQYSEVESPLLGSTQDRLFQFPLASTEEMVPHRGTCFFVLRAPSNRTVALFEKGMG